MFSVSICWSSGGCGAIWNSGALRSPGSRIAGRSERSASVVPPSTLSEPRRPLSRCERFGKVLRFSRPGGRTNAVSATSGTSTAWK